MRKLKKIPFLNNAGFSVALVLILAPIAAVSLYSLISLSITSRQQVVISRDFIRYNTLLDSFLDYTLYGIKNRWCFDSNWMRHSGATCPLSAPFSTESLLLEPDSARAIKNFLESTGKSVPATLGRTSFSYTLPVSNITVSHPLFNVLQSFRGAGLLVDAVQFDIARVDSALYPIRGREILLEVKVSLVLPGGSTLGFGAKSRISSTARVLVAPRELNYFGLVIAKDLHLDTGGIGTGGNFNIAPTTSGGIVFESPIYVNGDVYIPSTEKNQTQFLEKVFLSNASHIYEGPAQTPFVPKQAGGVTGQTFGDLPTVGGFFRGFDFDDLSDDGLKALTGQASSSVTPNFMDQCLGLTQAEGDLRATKQSRFLVTTTKADTATGAYTFQLSLNNMNRFVRQGYGPVINQPSAGVKFTSRGGSQIRFRMTVDYVGFNKMGSTPEKSKGYDLELGAGTALSGTFSSKTNNYTQPVGFTLSIPSPGQSPINQIQMNLQFIGQLQRIRSVKIDLDAYDLACYAGYDRRMENNTTNAVTDLYDSGYTRKNSLAFGPGGVLQGPAATLNQSIAQDAARAQTTVDPAYALGQKYYGLDYVTYYNTCFSATANNRTQSFGVADWAEESTFLNSTRNSWHFASSVKTVGSYPMTDELRIDGHETGFLVKSIAGKCVIPSSMTMVTGFFTCDRLVIESRSQPLTIIGTIIAGGSDISASAIAAGIHWKSIYANTSTSDLIASGALGVKSNCPIKTPIWNPEMSPQTRYDASNCSPISLRAKADPFTWTTVMPDCGVLNGGSSISCLYHPTRYILNELSREVVVE